MISIKPMNRGKPALAFFLVVVPVSVVNASDSGPWDIQWDVTNVADQTKFQIYLDDFKIHWKLLGANRGCDHKTPPVSIFKPMSCFKSQGKFDGTAHLGGDSIWAFTNAEVMRGFIKVITQQRERFLDQLNLGLRQANTHLRSDPSKSEIREWITRFRQRLRDRPDRTMNRRESENDYAKRLLRRNGIISECESISFFVQKMLNERCQVDARIYRISASQCHHVVVYIPEIDLLVDLGGYEGYEVNGTEDRLQSISQDTMVSQSNFLGRTRLHHGGYYSDNAYWLKVFGKLSLPKETSSDKLIQAMLDTVRRAHHDHFENGRTRRRSTGKLNQVRIYQGRNLSIYELHRLKKMGLDDSLIESGKVFKSVAQSLMFLNGIHPKTASAEALEFMRKKPEKLCPNVQLSKIRGDVWYKKIRPLFDRYSKQSDAEFQALYESSWRPKT